jgi:MoxR-like ATPase
MAIGKRFKVRTEADRVIKRVGGGEATERDKRFLGRALTAEKPHTYDEVYQAYKRKWLKTGVIRDRDGWSMPEPSDFLYTHVKELDIAYGEMLKYLDDTEITAPKRAELSKDMSETDDEYRLDDEGDIEPPSISGLEELLGEEGDTPDEEVKEPIIDDSVIGKIKASVAVPEEFKFADDMTFYTMLRNVFRGNNILVTGPSGCGKSSLGKILAEITNKPFYSFNFGDTMNPSAKLLGDTKFNKEDGTWFKPSRFVGAITDNSGAFIMLDEITRDRTGDLANILMPVLDGQKTLALDESDDADVVTLDDNAFFYATANIGREYLGCAHDLDRAWKDRFCGGLYELEYLPQKKEQSLVQIRVPQISEDNARRITEFAAKIRGLYKAEELNVAVSTRMCLTTAEFLVDGMTLIDALKHTCLPFYPVQGGDDTERVRVIQTIQSMGD